MDWLYWDRRFDQTEDLGVFMNAPPHHTHKLAHLGLSSARKGDFGVNLQEGWKQCG